MSIMAPSMQIPQVSQLPYHPHRRYDERNPSYMYFESQEPQREEPVIKKEHFGHYYTPSPPTARDYSGKTYSDRAQLFHSSRTGHPPVELHVAAPNPGRVDQADIGRAESRTSVMPSRRSAQGFYLGGPKSTNGSPDPSAADHGNAEQARLRLRYVAPTAPHQIQAQPEENLDLTRHQFNSHTIPSTTYEAQTRLRHISGAYQPTVAAPATFSLYHSNYYAEPDVMSLSYETRTFPDYPQSAMMHDPHQEQEDTSIQHHRYPSPPPPLSDHPYNPQNLDAATTLVMEEISEMPAKDESDAPSPGRSKPIPKPDREVTKGEDGRFVCNWVGCTEDVRSFGRKCEWSKHMDKHDRPYKCPAEGCEKLPGFTYSGGLLRHQREVHNLHGGPRKQLNCPHPNCKRYSGKGFSRQENLNEHLRRVHTDAGEMQNEEETEEDASERAGMKRKRGPARDEGVDLRQEMARLRNENEELRSQGELQRAQTASLMRQLQDLQALVGSRLQPNSSHQSHAAPQANMM